MLELQACSAVLGSGPPHACVVGTSPLLPAAPQECVDWIGDTPKPPVGGGGLKKEQLQWELGCFTSV